MDKTDEYEWFNNHMVAYDYVFEGRLSKEIYCRWVAIWKVISTQTYAVHEETTCLPRESYVSNIKIWGQKPPVSLPEGAIIFEKDDGIWEKRSKTCKYFFNDKKLHLTTSRIIVTTYDNSHPGGIFGLILSREETINNWRSTSYPIRMILRSNSYTHILKNNGYDISSIPSLSEEEDGTYR